MIPLYNLGHLATERAEDLSYGRQTCPDAGMVFMAGPRVAFLDEEPEAVA